MSETVTPGRGAASVELNDSDRSQLRTWNIAAAVLHLVSGIAMLVLGNDFSIPVTSFDFSGPPGTPVSEGTINSLFDAPLAPLTAAFAFLSAFFHLLVVSPFGANRYADELRHGRNRFRWVEYSLSSTLMIVIIMLITNTTDLAALIAVAFANVAMILFGWLMEVSNSPDRPAWWTPFWFGCVAGAGPWVALFTYLVVNLSQGDEGPPGFVYGILVSIFVLFNCFAVNQWLQYRRNGRWADYLHGERVYIVLSLVAKTALAWQLFANVLID